MLKIMEISTVNIGAKLFYNAKKMAMVNYYCK